VFVSFFNRLFPRISPQAGAPGEQTVFYEIAREAKGNFFPDFKLYHRTSATTVDLLLFIPHRGLYIGEKIPWRADELKGASVERPLPGGKQKASTRFDAVESTIRQKLEDVLSFDSTPCIRFAWMEHLSEKEFDALDPSFHALLPKSRLLFSDESISSARQKLELLAPYRSNPYASLKVIGSLNAHMLLLPTSQTPFGAYLSDEQLRFMDTGFQDKITTLCGSSGSGKSTLLLRKAVKTVLENPDRKVLIITPTLLAGELLRDKLVSLMEYGAFTVPLDSIAFYTPQSPEPLENMDILYEASAILCDDAYRLQDSFIEMLKRQRKNRWLLFGTVFRPDSNENLFLLQNRYREAKHFTTLRSGEKPVLFTLLLELRKRFCDTPRHDVMVILPEQRMLQQFKEAIDEYFGSDCRALIPGFSLQYQSLDDLLLATADDVGGLRIPHLFLVVPESSDDYAFELSRASETATIISFSNPHGENDAKDHQK